MDRIIPVAVHGAAGRMGQAVLHAALGCDGVRVVAALVRPGDGLDGRAFAATAPAGTRDLSYASVLDAGVTPRVLIDFSAAAAFDAALAVALERGIAFVSGTTGLDARQQAALGHAAASIPVLWSANFSLGVALLARFVAEAAQALPDWDCEIAEVHHRGKKDAPSGTALALGRAAAAARGVDFENVAVLSRSGRNAPRAAGSIGFAVTRGGDTVGEHAVSFAAAGERLELVHRATDRAIFARGALAAARWIADRAPGRHALADVLREFPPGLLAAPSRR